MILPTKNTDLDKSVIAVSAKILSKYAGRNIGFDILQDDFKTILGNNYWLVLLQCLHFLFLAGVVEYKMQEDVLEFKNANL